MKNNTILGLILITIGIIFIGNYQNYWNVEIFFNGWWTLFIIIPGIISLLKKQVKSGLTSISIGIFLLLAVNDIITWSLIGPLFLIVIGLTLLFTKKPKLSNIMESEYIAIFSDNESTITNKLKDTSITSIFGGVELDLRNAKLDKDITITATTIFGGIDILVPDNTQVIIKGTPIFGGIENKVKSTTGKIITIEAICIFAGIDIK